MREMRTGAGSSGQDKGVGGPEYPGTFPEYPEYYNPTPLKKSRPEI